ncbi:hypothetical protein N0V90_012456 [Kalmusia sp. IMI 367209]|nr:hypothetical protein N0V90_012456 [Kalmusia sp. IMI 367209]
MGYSEVLCHICGVSFNIGRIRTPAEPRSAAWSRFGPIMSNVHLVDDPQLYYGVYSSYVYGGRNSWIGECHRDAGCMFTIRKIKDEGRKWIVTSKGRRKLSPKEDVIEEDDQEDEDWEVESEDDERLEYISDVGEEDNEEGGDIEMDDVDDMQPDDSTRNAIRQFWIRGLMKERTSRDTISGHDDSALPAWHRGPLALESEDNVQDEMFPLFYPSEDATTEYGTDGSFDSDDSGSEDGRRNAQLDHRLGGKLGYFLKEQYDVEHIAGPGCLNRAGYSGHEIGAEEMRGCQIWQSLVRKPTNWGPQGEGWHPERWTFETSEDDEDFEKEGKFFLSGLSDHMPSRDYGNARIKPVRHGCKDPHPENCMWDESQFEAYSMPFHPSCFEVFKRASTLQYDTFDVDGLTSWWTNDAKNHQFNQSHHAPDVKKGTDQEWSHWKGSAYLAANPLFVPKLRDILHAASNTAPEFSPRNGAFSVHGTTPAGQDLLACLPAELKFQVLDNLRSSDIAALRLSSRTFRQVPISYFQKLLNREMPWLWEAWPTANNPTIISYSFWATVTPAEAERKLQKPIKAIAALNDYVNIVSSELPELEPILKEALPGEIQAVLDANQLEIDNDDDRKPFFLPPDRTNYYLLYALLTRHWAELRGLQNRKRIWEACQHILIQVKEMRENGEIEPLVRQS